MNEIEVETVEPEVGYYACDLVPETHEMLTTELEPFDFQNPPLDPSMVAVHLTETMLKNGGIGLAANQIGMPHRACVIAADPVICMFNPKIVAHSEESSMNEEGCLSFPNLYLKIRRYEVIRVRYTEPNGNTLTKKFEGLTSKIIQHEVDHLNGIVFTQRANKIHLERGRNKQRKIKKYAK